jgi:hypothetical protein
VRGIIVMLYQCLEPGHAWRSGRLIVNGDWAQIWGPGRLQGRVSAGATVKRGLVC